MGRARVALFLLFFGSVVLVPSGFGSIIIFSPVGSTTVSNGPDDFVSFSAVVKTEFSDKDFDGASIMIGTDAPSFESDPPERRISFTFNPEWKNKFADVSGNIPDPSYDSGFYKSDVFISSAMDLSTVGASSLSLGTIKISAKGLPAGDYTVGVDAYPGLNMLYLSEAWDDFKSSLVTFTVIPEPASLLLFLGLGALGLRTKMRYGK